MAGRQSAWAQALYVGLLVVGWIRSRRGVRVVHRAALLIGIVLLAWVAYRVLGPAEDSRFETAAPLSAAEAREELGLDVPPEAREVQYAVYSCFRAFEERLRFRAPPGVCLDFARQEIIHWQEEGETWVGPMPITEPPALDHGGMLNVRWFDVHQIKEGVDAWAVGGSEARIWVDTQRGIFYRRRRD